MAVLQVGREQAAGLLEQVPPLYTLLDLRTICRHNFYKLAATR